MRKIIVLTTILMLLLVILIALTLPKGRVCRIKVVGLNVGVYLDAGCESPVRIIKISNVKQGVPYKFKVYVRNEVNEDVRLHLETRDWNPPDAEHYVFCYWDRENCTLKPNEVKSASIIVYVFPLIRKFEYKGYFDFELVIVGEKFK